MASVFDRNEPACYSAAIALIACATLGLALVYQYVWGYVPCALCMLQRWPYYVGIPFAVAATAVIQPRGLLRKHAKIILALLGGIFAAGAVMGAYHAGVEWSWWEGPASCAPAASNGGSVADLFGGNAPRFVSCTTASWRFLGLSFAGWNVLISCALASIALVGVGQSKKLEPR